MSWQAYTGTRGWSRRFVERLAGDEWRTPTFLSDPRGSANACSRGNWPRRLVEGSPPEALAACDRCPACVQVEAGTHPDFFAVSRPEESLDVADRFDPRVVPDVCPEARAGTAR